MSDNTSAPQTAEPPVPPVLPSYPPIEPFSPSMELPKPRRDFPSATVYMYITYIELWWARHDKYNHLVASCKYIYDNTTAETNDTSLLQMLTIAVDIAHEKMIEDFAEMEQNLRQGTLETEDPSLVGIWVLDVVEVLEEDRVNSDRWFLLRFKTHIFPGLEIDSRLK